MCHLSHVGNRNERDGCRVQSDASSGPALKFQLASKGTLFRLLTGFWDCLARSPVPVLAVSGHAMSPSMTRVARNSVCIRVFCRCFFSCSLRSWTKKYENTLHPQIWMTGTVIKRAIILGVYITCQTNNAIHLTREIPGLPSPFVKDRYDKRTK